MSVKMHTRELFLLCYVAFRETSTMVLIMRILLAVYPVKIDVNIIKMKSITSEVYVPQPIARGSKCFSYFDVRTHARWMELSRLYVHTCVQV